ncbi:MAG TPA: serine/threonine-protein kinase [Verrucomicrobiae bacterium]|nr:serine/threonine-protein kinase [Verrucomicrobiae bacterium]
MPARLNCSRCGGELPLDAPGRNCPACLIQLATELPEQELLSPPGPVAAAGFAIGSFSRYFGDYELQGEIARGAMGVVFCARQVSLNRPVALKMILAGHLASAQQVQRFYIEAEAAAKLDHPNIVPIYEVGIHEGQHYYSMRRIEGGNLAEHLSASHGRLPSRDAARIVCTVAKAVHYAHQHQVLHRDLKPTNILLDRHGIPYVTDFGLAKIIAEDYELTGTLGVLGTPCYMAPEQAAGNLDKITTAADIYSLGSILFSLVAGRPPFQAATAFDTLRLVTEQEAPSLNKFISRADRDLDTICLKCLQKDPDARYGSCQALAEELDRWLSGEPILARPVGQAERLWRWARRKRALAALMCALLLSFVTLAVGSAVAALRIRAAHMVATEKLYESYLAQARALRLSGREGQRFESLEAAKKAAEIRASVQARSEAIGSLALTDLRFVESHQDVDSLIESYDPTLRVCARGLDDGRTIVLNCSNRSEILTLPSAGGTLEWMFGLSPGGRFFAGRYSTGVSVVWDTERKGQVIRDQANWSAADFSADAQQFIASCEDGMVHRFRLSPFQPLPAFRVADPYRVIRLRPQADWVAGFGEGLKNVEVREVNGGALRKSLPHPARVTALAWSPSGNSLAVGCENGRLFIWNAETGEKQTELEGHEDYIVSVGFSHSGGLVGSSSWDRRFHLWDMDTAQCLITAPSYACGNVLFDLDDRRVGYVQNDRAAGLLAIEPSAIFSLLTCPKSASRGAWSVDVSPDGRLVAAAMEDHVRIWDRVRPRNSWSLPGGCRSALFTRDGQNLITCGYGLLALWPIERQMGQAANLVRFGPRQTIRRGLDFRSGTLSSDDRWVAVANNTGASIAFYEILNPTNAFALASHPATAYPSISQNGKWAASGTWKGSGVRVWDLQTRRFVCDLPTSDSARVCFSPDNRWLVTGGTNYGVWAIGSWKLKYSLTRLNPADPEGSIAFSDDAQVLAVVRSPGVIDLVVPASGELLARLEAPRTSNLKGLRFSRDGGRLFALEWDQQVQVWDLQQMRAELFKLGLDWNAPPFPRDPLRSQPQVGPIVFSLAPEE